MDEEAADISSSEVDSLERSRSSSVSESEQSTKDDMTDSYLLIPYGFQSKACYKPKSKSKEITGVTYNSRSRQFIILDSRGITAWSHNSVVNSISRLLDYPSYQFNLIRLLLHSKKFNVYFGLSKDYALKVFNLNFHEVFSVVSDMNSVLCMVFNSVTDEVITGGTGGIRFWSFGEIEASEHSLNKDSRPMANYGLILRCEHPTMGGSMVKDIVLDERNQRLYCLSERNVVAYDIRGNFLFLLKSHQGNVTGCVYSKFSNFVVTGGSDSSVNVWSSNGGCIHSFHGHSKIITNVLLHPEAPSLVITSSLDGTVKIFSLDIMEEIYSHPVFAEGVQWMNFISNDLLYCASSKALQVFSINHTADFWTTIRCPLKSLSLSHHHNCKTRRVIAIAEDNSARLLSKTSHLLSTVLPPPSVTATERDKLSVRAHAYSPLYGLMYLLVNEEEIWVYYTKTNPANRVEVWQISDVREINHRDSEGPNVAGTSTCKPLPSLSGTSAACDRAPSRSHSTSPSVLPTAKLVDGVSCLALALLSSSVDNNKNNNSNNNNYNKEDSSSDIACYLVAGLQDGRLLFLSPFAASLMYFQLQVTKGAVLSVQHDAAHSSLVVNTMTLCEFTIQIRGLPHLELDHQVSVGNDLTCFIRMDSLLLSGHKTGRLNLCHVGPEGQVIYKNAARKSSAQKLSKDHLDCVVSVDANNDLQLFCSSSKDGCIKIWDNTKILLREIIMDHSLTTVCFLNSSGDLLAGFKNHVFFINRDKVQLSFYSRRTKSRKNSGMSETESDVYEDPRVRFEYKKIVPPEPVRMETYLVPFANMSINLDRFLSGHLPPSGLNDEETDGHDETESELSDAFSVAPTDVYMSQTGSPQSRSRSSSLVSSWELPNLGHSPVSSPPRTPPPVMSPVVELETENEENTLQDNELPNEDSGQSCRPSSKSSPRKQESRKSVDNTPVFSLRRRPGLSQVKIDSRSIRAGASINADKHETARNVRVGPEVVAKQNDHQKSQVRRSPRAVVKKSKQPSQTSPRRVKSQRSVGQSVALNRDFEARSTAAKEEKVADDELGHEKPRDDLYLDVLGNSSENTRASRKFEEVVKAGGKAKQVPYDDVLNKVAKKLEFNANNLDSASKGKFVKSQIKDSPAADTSLSVLRSIDKQTDITKETSNLSEDIFDSGREEHTSCNEVVGTPRQIQEKSFFPGRSDMGRLPSTNSALSHFSRKNSGATSKLSEIIVAEVSDDSDISQEDDLVEDVLQSSTDEFARSDLEEEMQEKFASKSVSFLEDDRQSRNSSTISKRRSSSKATVRRGRRSVSSCNPSPKVVSVLQSPYADNENGQHLHPNTALKIYALSKSRRGSPGLTPVSRPRVKQRSFVRHYASEESLAVQNGRELAEENLERIIRKRREVRDAEREERVTEVMKEENSGRKTPREKDDLVNWCINALRDKSKYPVFSPKPRLRSRRSMNLEKNEGKVDVEDTAARVHDPDDQGQGTQNNRAAKTDLQTWKSEQTIASPEYGAWFGKNSGKCFSLGELFSLNQGSKKGLSPFVPDITVYSEGWQDRFLERTKLLKEKRLERERRVTETRRANEEELEESRRKYREWTENELSVRDVAEVYPQTPEDDLKNRRSTFEDFKNNPAISQPYRLGKFSSEDESWVNALKIDPESQHPVDSIFELIPRPKSAPSIPSKCRKYILVATESDDDRNSPEITPLEESLILRRFPKSKLRARIGSRYGSGLHRPHSVAELQT